MTFGELIRKERISQSLNKSKLARMLKTNRNRIAQIEADKARVTVEEVYFLTKALDINPYQAIQTIFIQFLEEKTNENLYT